VARNEILRDADHLSLPVPADTAAGAPVLVGSIIGITQTKEGEGGNADGYASVWRKGAHRVSVAGTVASVGLPIYITSSNTLTTTSTSNSLWGYALETKGSGTGTILVAMAKV
jgi:predicted RecA/RadA family phage recombinase